MSSKGFKRNKACSTNQTHSGIWVVIYVATCATFKDKLKKMKKNQSPPAPPEKNKELELSNSTDVHLKKQRQKEFLEKMSPSNNIITQIILHNVVPLKCPKQRIS